MKQNTNILTILGVIVNVFTQKIVLKMRPLKKQGFTGA